MTLAPERPAHTRWLNQIRPFADGDYAASVALVNAVYPEYPETVAEWQHSDATRDPKCKHAAWLVEHNGQVIGYANYHQYADMYHPRRFGISAAVHPTYQGQGVGAALYAQVTAALQAFDPLSLRTEAREDMARSIRFLQDRGFREEMRAWESRLDVASFDFRSYAHVEEGLRAKGFAIKTMSELAGDPERDRKLYELDVDLTLDEPHPEPYTPISYDQFMRQVFDNPDLLPDAYFVAIHNGRYAGSSALWDNHAASDELYTGLTGVRREYRRNGVALALKLRAIAYARDHGIRSIKTWNDATNRPMLSINERLGFVKQPIWIDFVKALTSDERGMMSVER